MALVVGLCSLTDPALREQRLHRGSVGPGFSFKPDFGPSDLAKLATERALSASGVPLDQIDFVISCTNTPDYNNPGLVSCLLGKLGRTALPGLELKALSAGPLYGLDLASTLIASGQAKNILLIGTDLLSRFFGGVDDFSRLTKTQSEAARVFSDGAFACVVSAKSSHTPAFRFLGGRVEALGEEQYSLHCRLPSSSNFPLRISASDIENYRHLPELDPEPFERLLFARLPSIYEAALHATNPTGCLPKKIIFDAPTNCSAKVASALTLEECLPEGFVSCGYSGSAGAFHYLSVAKSSGSVSSGEVICLGAAAAGMHLGFIFLEVL